MAGATVALGKHQPPVQPRGIRNQMVGLDEAVRAKTDSLDTLGNTTAATGKDFVLDSEVWISLSLLAACQTTWASG